jgi:hypothetical protein
MPPVVPVTSVETTPPLLRKQLADGRVLLHLADVPRDGGGWFYAELYGSQAATDATTGTEVNKDELAYKLVRRKLVGSGRWDDDGEPFADFNAYCAEPKDGFAGRFRVRDDGSGEPSGRGLLVLARESPTEPGKYEFTPVVPEYNFWRVDSYTPRTGPPNNLTPGLYTCVLVELVRDADTGTAGDQEEWRDVSPEVKLEGCIRTPMKMIDDSRISSLRLPIEEDTVVQVRPSPTNKGRYEIYGGSIQKWGKDFVVAVCAECTEFAYPPQIVVKTAWESLAIFGYDLTVFNMPAGTGGSGERDATAGQFDPPNDVGIP